MPTRSLLSWRILRSYLLVTALCVGASAVAAWWAGGLEGASRGRLIIGFAAAAAAGALVSQVLARRFARPIDEIRHGAERLGRGDLGAVIEAEGGPEISALAESINRMARQLDGRIAELTRERNEREAILESMQEGVLAIDLEDRILTINRQAELLLGVSALRARRRLVQEALRNAALQRYLSSIHREGHTEPEEGVLIPGHGETLLAAKSAPLRDGDGESIGVVVVLANVTRLHQLENLRREFVANVSHELRTPITSLKGFAETLLDGALEDAHESRRFVEIIARQADRLNVIIEDLLALSRLERREELAMEELKVAELLDQCVELARPLAEERESTIDVHCEEGLAIHGNPGLLEQAVLNLLDNALKYSPPGSPVKVDGRLDGDFVSITVEDSGSGIEDVHLPRLFERFYRVDKARSRDVGGTGLGLSIVKNVATAHGGSVQVHSELGAGSRFTMRLPAVLDESPAMQEAG